MAWIHVKVSKIFQYYYCCSSTKKEITVFSLKVIDITKKLIFSIKALRVFVESVLRYGLPVNFQAMVLLPQKKTQKKLRDVLNQQYAHLDSPGGGNAADVNIFNRIYRLRDHTRD